MSKIVKKGSKFYFTVLPCEDLTEVLLGGKVETREIAKEALEGAEDSVAIVEVEVKSVKEVKLGVVVTKSIQQFTYATKDC